MSTLTDNTSPRKGLRDRDIAPAWKVLKRAEAAGLTFSVSGTTLTISYPEPEDQWFDLHYEILKHKTLIAKLVLVRQMMEQDANG